MLLLVNLLVSAGAQCLSNSNCSTHGTCTKRFCVCDENWMTSDCSVPLSALAQSPLYGFFRWGGFVWYFLLTMVLLYCVQHVGRRKGLKWLCVHDMKNGTVKNYDTQQLTLVLVLLHCVLCTIQYASDPYSIRDPRRIPTFVQWLLWYGDYTALMASGYTMIRLWVKTSTALNQIAVRAAHRFDILAIALLVVFILLCIIRAITFVSSAGAGGEGHTSKVLGYFTLFFGALYAIVIVVFALRYGFILLRHLRDNSAAKKNGGHAIQKLTLFVMAMMASIVANIVTQTIQKVIGTNDQTLEYAVGSRACLAIFIIVIPIAIGSVNGQTSHEERPNHVRGLSRSRTAGSKRFGPRENTSGTDKSGKSATDSAVEAVAIPYNSDNYAQAPRGSSKGSPPTIIEVIPEAVNEKTSTTLTIPLSDASHTRFESLHSPDSPNPGISPSFGEAD